MSLALALKTALALNEYETEQQQKKELKEKAWNPDVLVTGGVTWWNRKVVKQVVDKKTNVIKDKVTIQKVKITVLTQDQDPTEVSNKGKFSFRNACGNKVFLSVKSYDEAYRFVNEIYGSKSFYTVSKEL